MVAFLRCLLLLAACAGHTSGYAVGPAVPLDKLFDQADIVFEGTVSANDDPSDREMFGNLPGYKTQDSLFKVHYLLKGAGSEDPLIFRHYTPTRSAPGMEGYDPQFYEFDLGRSYLVFAKKLPGAPANLYQQISMSHTGMTDEGVLWCADENPIRRAPIRDVVWTDLTRLLKSPDPKNVLYAIEHLDQFSGAGGLGGLTFGTLSEFQHLDVLALLHGLVHSPDPSIARAAIQIVGSHNPYMHRERAPYWLGTIGENMPGLTKYDLSALNPGGLLYWRDLQSVVDGKADEVTRALALTALGLVREPALQKPLARWLTDPSAPVRSAASLLLADFPFLATRPRFTDLLKDPLADIRVSAALAIAFGRQAALADLLVPLLKDKESKVREYAAMSLLSFSSADPGIAAIFKSEVANPEYGPLFLLAIARTDPQPYVEQVAALIGHDVLLGNWWGGQTVGSSAWQILFKYLQSRPFAELKSGGDDRYLDAFENTAPNESGNASQIYAFYLTHGLADRAKNFRIKVDRISTYDQEPMFKEVDSSPSAFKWNMSRLAAEIAADRIQLSGERVRGISPKKIPLISSNP